MGSITRVDPRVLTTLLDGDFVPVVSPIALGEDGDGLNCNADDAARAVAEALGAESLVFLTDVGGILIDSHNSKTAVDHMDVKRRRSSSTRPHRRGMVPRMRGCIHAIRAGVGQVSILDGRVEHSLLLICWASGPLERRSQDKQKGWPTRPSFFHIFSTSPPQPRQSGGIWGPLSF